MTQSAILGATGASTMIDLAIERQERTPTRNFASMPIAPIDEMDFIVQYFDCCEWSGKPYLWRECAPVEC